MGLSKGLVMIADHQMDDLMLPSLPRSEFTNMQYQRRYIGTVYTADQMREYAKKAVEADRAAMKMALECVEAWDRGCDRDDYWRDIEEAVSALRQRLSLD